MRRELLLKIISPPEKVKKFMRWGWNIPPVYGYWKHRNGGFAPSEGNLIDEITMGNGTASYIN